MLTCMNFHVKSPPFLGFSLRFFLGFPGGTVVKNLPANAGGEGEEFNSWVKKSPWKRKWQPIPVFLPEESQGQEPGEQQSLGLQSWTQLSGLGRGIGWVKYHRTCCSYQHSDCYKHLVNFSSFEKVFRKLWPFFFCQCFCRLFGKQIYRYPHSIILGSLDLPTPNLFSHCWLKQSQAFFFY